MDDVFVYIVDLPENIAEMVVPCVGGYTVYLDAKLSYTGKLEAYHHALKHIDRNDFEKENVQKIEAEAHYGHSEEKR